ncbi:DUF397 domain-containing protein [Streptomyces sp. NPDC127068]|uniref:DUF397 domain-containing protein n=1 Tax=Streptomyces sp. NPDC127068 TaxID=3347127 RepID=UPI003653047A
MTNEWVRSSYSDGHGNCVETQVRDTSVAARDSKQYAGPEVVTSRSGWQRFVSSLRTGDLHP